MFRAKKSQMIYIEAASGADLMRQYNSEMDQLAKKMATVTDKIIDATKLTAVILYEVTERVPECLRDEYELAGIFPVCSECPHFDGDGHGNGHCYRADGRLRHDDEICKMRWREIENEERRGVNASQFSSRNDAARREPSAAR